MPLAEVKMEKPSGKLLFLNIELGTVEQCSRLPNDKTKTLRDLVSSAVRARKTTLWDCQSLVGHLNFACRVIAPG